MSGYKCETCKHGDLPTYRFPCDVCHGGDQYEPEEGMVRTMTIEQMIERFDGSLAYSTNSKEICQYIADLLKELKERRKAPEIITCGECEFSCKDEDSDIANYAGYADEVYCSEHDIYKHADWYCADAERITE